MIIHKPVCYDVFSCLAAKCPDSCCKEWEVEIDETSAAFYHTLEGPLGDRLRAVLKEDPQWGTVMSIENGRCPMWCDDGLCRIQRELGHDALCKTCRDFPRLCHDYGSFQEWGLELSCPEVARLILSSPDTAMLTLEVSGGEPPEYDQADMDVLLQTRAFAREILCDRQYSVPQVLTLLLYFGYHAQAILDGGEAPDFDAEEILKEAENFAQADGKQVLLEFFSGLEILTKDWQEQLSRPHSPTPWTDSFRQLARYFVDRYWLQAVSDYDIVSRVKMAVTSCIVVHLLGGDIIETAQHYSKEIENSDRNVEAILDAAYSHPALTDTNLLGLLM
ncbi:MAG: hypothetical protein E7462_06690 [Ruminococcaceae bacterium]|nr:hypothetical protein [Oscillospiraceae bacterium]